MAAQQEHGAIAHALAESKNIAMIDENLAASTATLVAVLKVTQQLAPQAADAALRTLGAATGMTGAATLKKILAHNPVLQEASATTKDDDATMYENLVAAVYKAYGTNPARPTWPLHIDWRHETGKSILGLLHMCKDTMTQPEIAKVTADVVSTARHANPVQADAYAAHAGVAALVAAARMGAAPMPVQEARDHVTAAVLAMRAAPELGALPMAWAQTRIEHKTGQRTASANATTSKTTVGATGACPLHSGDQPAQHKADECRSLLGMLRDAKVDKLPSQLASEGRCIGCGGTNHVLRKCPSRERQRG